MYSTVVITPESIEYAMQKLKNFIVVNKEGDVEEKLDALEFYCTALGLNEDMVFALYENLNAQFHEGSNHIFVGTLIGLAMAEHGIENYAQRN